MKWITILTLIFSGALSRLDGAPALVRCAQEIVGASPKAPPETVCFSWAKARQVAHIRFEGGELARTGQQSNTYLFALRKG